MLCAGAADSVLGLYLDRDKEGFVFWGVEFQVVWTYLHGCLIYEIGKNS